MGLFDFSFGYSSNKSNTKSVLDKEDTAWLYQQQSDQWRANTEWYNDKGYSMLRAGLEKAGYNPLLALGAQPLNGATVQGSAMTTTGETNATSFNGTMPISMSAYRAQMDNMRADTLLKHAQTDETYSRSGLENSQRVLADKDIPYRSRRNALEVIGMEIENDKKQAEIRKIEAETGVAISQVQLNNVESQYKRILSNYTIDQQKYVRTITQKISQGMDLNKPEQDFVKNHPELAQFYAGMRQFGNAFGSLLHSININSYENVTVER